jgi:dihydroorotase
LKDGTGLTFRRAEGEGGVLIRGGRVVDPKAGADAVRDLCVEDGRICDPGAASGGFRVFDASGCAVVPGLVDLHVHFREPGGCHKEDIASGSLAAARGGYTTVCCMPNTAPAIDCAEVLRLVDRAGRAAGTVNLLAAGAMTRGQAGLALSDIGGMLAADTRCRELIGGGICALSEDGKTLMDTRLMRRVAEEAAGRGLLIMDHTENPDMSAGGVMNAGPAAERLGFKGIPAAAEADIVARDIELAKEFGCRIHLQHVSAAESVRLIRAAKRGGAPVSAETAPHYIALNDEAVSRIGSSAKMNPPLRGEADRLAVIEGLCDGTIDVIATDHAPHAAAEKALPLEAAPFGVVGLETGFAVCYTVLVLGGYMDLPALIERMSVRPAGIIGLPRGGLAPGAAADLAVFELTRPWSVDGGRFASKGRNTPFQGMRVFGRTRLTLLGGKVVFDDRQVDG